MANSADPDPLASSEANWSGSTLFARVYPGSAGQGLRVYKIVFIIAAILNTLFLGFMMS